VGGNDDWGFIFGHFIGHLGFPLTLFSLHIMPFPTLTCIPNLKENHICTNYQKNPSTCAACGERKRKSMDVATV
jgi:hypothetical protein